MSSYLPSISGITGILESQYTYLFSNWFATFSVSVVASMLALCVTLSAVLVSAKYKVISPVLSAASAISQSFPLQAIAPLILIVFGLSFWTKVLIAYLIAFFPIYGSLSQSLSAIDRKYGVLQRATRARPWRFALSVRLPALLPDILSASKVGFTLSVLGAVVAEFVQPNEGLGYVILVAQSSYNLDLIYTAVLILIAQGLLFYGGLSYFEGQARRARGQ